MTSAAIIGAQDFHNINDFGAVGDGKALNTNAIQDAVDHVSGLGGGTVYLPAGQYLTGTIVLKSNINLYLGSGAVLLGSNKLSDYSAEHPHLLYAESASNIKIAGEGVIDGQGREYWDEDYRPYGRPESIIHLENCSFITIRDISIRHAPNHCVVLFTSDHAIVDGITIINEMRAPNTDGVNIRGTHHTRISNCFISTGDDAICVKTNERSVENLTVTNCVLESDDAALKFGTGSGNDARFCSFSNIIIRNTRYGIAMFMKDGGTYERCTFSGISIHTGSRHSTEYPVYLDIDRRTEQSILGKIRDISFQDIQVYTRGKVLVAGHPEASLERINFNRVYMVVDDPADLSQERKPKGNKGVPWWPGSADFSSTPSCFTIGNAEQVTLSSLMIIPGESIQTNNRHALEFIGVSGITVTHLVACQLVYGGDRSTIMVTDSDNLSVSSSIASPGSGIFLEVKGLQTGLLKLFDNDLTEAGKILEDKSGIPEEAKIMQNNLLPVESR